MSILDKIKKYGIPEQIIDLKFASQLSHITRQSDIGVICGCGDKKTLKIVSVLRTISRVGVYRCLSCGMKEKHQDPEYKEKHRVGMVESWSDEKRERQSQISKDLWSDPEFAEKQKQISTAIWNDPEKRQQSSELVKGLWEDPERKAHYEKIWSDPKKVSDHAQIISDVWKDPEYRAKQDSLHSSLEHRQLQSRLVIERWNDPEYRELIIESQKLLWTIPEYREVMTNRIRELWKDPAYIEKQKAAAIDPALLQLKAENAKKQWQDPIFREKMDKLWKDPAFREKMARARASVLINGKDSILERVVQTLLNALDIPYVRHHVIGYWEFDLFIPSHNLLIECQGEYWHSTRQSQDASKFTYVDEYFPEYKLIYLWEREFLNPGIIKQKLIRELFGEDSPIASQDFSFTNVSIRPLNVQDKLPNSYYSESEEFLQSFHYAGFGRSAKQIFGAFLDDKLIAICKFATPVRMEVATSMNLSPSQVLELDRFCIHPQYQKKNFASWFISRCSASIFKQFSRLSTLVSFSDSTFGHLGIIYKAANWEELHQTKPDYHYINSEGFVIHKKTLYNHAIKNNMKESDYVSKYDYLKVYGKSKTKFVLMRN
jgi:hypothetical protein